MSTVEIVLVTTAVLFGALTQRTTGLGFALVAAPFLVVIAGPKIGVSLGNALAIVLCLTVLARTWRSTRWRSVLLLAIPALCVIPFGGALVRGIAQGPLLIGVGAMSIAAVVVVIAGRRRVLLQGIGGAVGAGAASGFMNVTAGVGGPMMTAYALSQRWPREVFIPTAQAYLLLINIASLGVKGFPHLGVSTWVLALAALLVGAVGGEWLSPRIPQAAGQAFVIVVALAGGAAAVLRGVLLMG